MTSVRLGLLSTARINHYLLAAAAASEEATFVAVASRERARAETYARTHGLERAYGSYEQLLGDDGVDAVYISLPNALHVEWTMRALRAGKHVLCEKPFARDPDKVVAAFALADRRRLVLTEAFMYRHHPQIGRLRALLAQGAIGELAVIRASLSFTLPGGEADVRRSTDLDGGALMDVGAYCVSAARLLAGEPVRACGESVSGPDRPDERFAGLLRFPGDVVALFDAGMDLPRRDHLEVVGTFGSAVLDDPWHGRGGSITLRREYSAERITIAPCDPYRRQLDNFCRSIRGLEMPLVDRDDAIGQARALDALLRAATTRTPQEIKREPAPSSPATHRL